MRILISATIDGYFAYVPGFSATTLSQIHKSSIGFCLSTSAKFCKANNHNFGKISRCFKDSSGSAIECGRKKQQRLRRR